MELSRMGRALTTAVIFVFAGCGGAGTTSAVPQSIVASVAHHGSWMQPGTSSEDLLYVTQDDGLAVFSYPDLKLVGHLYLPQGYGGGNACSDKKGNVFVPFVNLSNQDSGVFEYSHGGTSPIKTLTGPSGYKPQGCSLDSMTGNLAVTNKYYVSEHRYGNLLIYAKGTGAPTSYSDPSMSVYGDPAYDNRGNLFIAGSGSSSLFALAELPKEDDTLINLAVNENGFTSIGDFMNWDGKYLAINASPGSGRFRPQLIYQVQVSGSTASVVRALHFHHWVGEGQSFSLQGAYLVSSEGGRDEHLRRVALWKYPAGGQPVMFASGHAFCWGFTVSVAASAPRIHR